MILIIVSPDGCSMCSSTETLVFSSGYQYIVYQLTVTPSAIIVTRIPMPYTWLDVGSVVLNS